MLAQEELKKHWLGGPDDRVCALEQEEEEEKQRERERDAERN